MNKVLKCVKVNFSGFFTFIADYILYDTYQLHETCEHWLVRLSGQLGSKLIARLGSGWLEVQVSSARLARYGFIRGSTQLLILSSARDFVLSSVWLGSALSRDSARARLIKVLIYWRVTSQESTYPLVLSFGSQHAAFDTLTREDSETKLSNTRFHQNRLNRFTSPGLGARFAGLARSSARFGSGSLFGLTQGSFLGSRHEDSARLRSRLVSVCSRHGSARVSAYHRSGIRLSAARLDSLFGTRLISARGSGSAWD